MYKGTIFNIQRFSTHDGPGIRTVVFMKGCPLNCSWCHNPESKSTKPEIFFKEDLCIGCGTCRVCQKGCHSFDDGHNYARENCISCGNCAENCPTKALECCGEEMTAEQILEAVLRDKAFYHQSGGGITLSGGEPLLQYDLTLELLQLCKEQGLHTAIETCGFTHQDLTMLHKYTDLWLYDVKVLPEEDHIRHTGVSNRQILANLQNLDQMGARIILRCPIIPGVNLNDAHFEELAKLANTLKNLQQIHLEPYHPLGLSKAQQLGKTQAFQDPDFLSAEVLNPYAVFLRKSTAAEIIIA